MITDATAGFLVAILILLCGMPALKIPGLVMSLRLSRRIRAELADN